MRAEPRPGIGGEAALHAAYLDFYRDTVTDKLRSLPEALRRRSVLPSGWTPLELVSHLAHMERRWLVWGFLGESVAEPWGDSSGDPDRPWHVPDEHSTGDVLAAMAAGAARTREILASTSLDTVAATGGRFDTTTLPPDLRWICFHVLQEYARHAGHLDIVVELTAGLTGE